MHTLEGLVAKIQKDTSPAFAKLRAETEDRERLPSGLFPLDLATGGGLPQGCMSVLYGPESSGKTNLALRYLRNAQLLHPDMRCAFIDAEGSFDGIWAERMGVDLDRLVLITPSYGEDAVDWTEAALAASDCCCVVLDSIAAITPGATIEKEAGRMDVAGNSALISRLMAKSSFAIGMAQNEDRYPTFIAINQVRYKVGQMFGDPETMPGGKKFFHASRMTLRLYGKNLVDKQIDPNLPAYKQTSVVLKKWKVPIVNPEAQYNMAMIKTPSLQEGQVDDWPTVQKYLKELQWLSKKGSKYQFLDKTYDKMSEVREVCDGDTEFGRNLRQKVIGTCLEKIGISAQH
jgi:recombination protein RecA